MKLIIFTLIIILIYVYYFYYIKDKEYFYVIPYNGIINDKLIDSLSLNNVIDDKYKNNYYYEYTDVEYEKKLKDLLLNKNTNVKSYKEFINYILSVLNNSKDFVNIQIVEDNKLSNDKIEILLYRENKFEGKHVVLIIDKIWNIKDIKVLGSVSEDKIGLFPVSFNSTDNNNMIIGNINDNNDKILDPAEPITFSKSENIITDNKDKDKYLKLSKNLFDNKLEIMDDTKYERLEHDLSETALYSKYYIL